MSCRGAVGTIIPISDAVREVMEGTVDTAGFIAADEVTRRVDRLRGLGRANISAVTCALTIMTRWGLVDEVFVGGRSWYRASSAMASATVAQRRLEA